jgi:hypothetical protein
LTNCFVAKLLTITLNTNSSIASERSLKRQARAQEEQAAAQRRQVELQEERLKKREKEAEEKGQKSLKP